LLLTKLILLLLIYFSLVLGDDSDSVGGYASGIDAVLLGVAGLRGDSSYVPSSPKWQIKYEQLSGSISYEEFSEIKIHSAFFLTYYWNWNIEGERDSWSITECLDRIDIPLDYFTEGISSSIYEKYIHRDGGYGCGANNGWLVINDSISLWVPCGIYQDDLNDLAIVFDFDDEYLAETHFNFGVDSTGIVRTELKFPQNEYIIVNDSTLLIE